MEAAASAGLTPSGFAAESVVAVTQHRALPELEPFRVLLQELMHLRTQLRRHNCEVQQALRQLNARGEAPDWLVEAVDLSNHAVMRIDGAVDGLGTLLRNGRTAFPKR